jgi:A118 family predicted phage portal protein
VPLPDRSVKWPPPQLHGITQHLHEWGAWYSGDVDRLNAVYEQRQRTLDRPAQYRGGIQGSAARMFYGRPVGDLTRPRRQLHVPIAADICQASADLLFAEPPTFTSPDGKTQDRLDGLSDDGLHTVLAEAAEVDAALGGVFLRVSWDPTVVVDRPFVTPVHADAAVPEFRWNNLTAVTFWWKVHEESQLVLRHLERHELDPNTGDGLVLHGLYEGSPDDLGRPIPLTEHPSTEHLAAEVDADGAIVAGRTPGLCVVYVPNQRPQRRWRNHPLGSNLGRSDLDGIEPLMDRLDATWSSWMRDIDLGRARIIVSQSMLTSYGPGNGAGFDLDQEVFTPLNAPPGSIAQGGGQGITPQQFAIRVAEHRDTCQELTETILRSAGYSAQTFGESESGGAITATEVAARNQRSFTTRDRKIRLWRPASVRLLAKLLTIDAAIFGGGYDPDGLDVEFSTSVQDSPEALARTAQALRTAEAASTATLVALNHPEWSAEDIATEVALINAEAGRVVPDPIGLGESGADLP